MIKLNKIQEILLQMMFIVFFLVLLIPLANNETVINLIFPNINIHSYPIGYLYFVIFVFAVYSFMRLRKNLKELNSKWRYLMYLVIFIWLTSDVRAAVGERIMNYRNGLQAIELLVNKSEIKYQKDTLGRVYIDGHISFRNYSSHTVGFNGILHGENFLLQYNDSIADIHLPNNELPGKPIEIPPKSNYVYQVKLSTGLEVNTLMYSKYNGAINRIKKFTIYAGKEKRMFNK